jgi:ATP-binding cassette subfamily B (MDR/TAP) protein 1
MQATVEQKPTPSTSNTPAKMEKAPSYRDLLHFSPGWCLLWLFSLLLAALASGAIVPVQAYILGQLTQLLGSFVPGSEAAANFEKDVTAWILLLVGVGGVACAVYGIFFASWQTFGDIQVKRVYTSLFNRMIQHDIEWFDKRQDGVASLVTRTQSWVDPVRVSNSY